MSLLSGLPSLTEGKTIGHFRVVFYLSVRTTLPAKPLIRKWVLPTASFNFHADQTCFRKKSFARTLGNGLLTQKQPKSSRQIPNPNKLHEVPRSAPKIVTSVCRITSCYLATTLLGIRGLTQFYNSSTVVIYNDLRFSASKMLVKNTP